MKKTISLLLSCALLCLILTGCGKEKADTDSAKYDRILYKNGLEQYVKLGNYKEIAIDTDSEEYQEIYNSLISEDTADNDLYSDTQITEGTVQNGDIANIDYEGKKDGVAFEGGTSAGYDLTIGSGTFIPGFEEGLIGKKIGSTVDLNVTFPENYQSEELAGQPVVFTVKINYVKQPMKPEEFYGDLGFESVDAYWEDLKGRALNQYLMDALEESSEIKSYPDEDLNYLYQAQKKVIEQQLQQQYGIDFASYLQYIGQTESAFKTNVTEQSIKPNMKSQMIKYAIFDKEKLSLSESEKNAAQDWETESKAIGNAVIEFLTKNAKIQ